MWRGKPRTAAVLLTLGGVLVIAAVTVPTMLGPVERAWMALARLISKVTTPIFMSVVYFLVITPIGFARRMSGGAMTAKRDHNVSNWAPHTPAADAVERMERQF